MASALDKLREHTAALEAVVKASQEIERVLERVQAELVPLVSDLREVRGEIEKIRKQRDAGGLSWTEAIPGDVVELVELPVNASCNNVSIMGKLKPLQHDGCGVQEPVEEFGGA